jgi:hypothetical protein
MFCLLVGRGLPVPEPVPEVRADEFHGHDVLLGEAMPLWLGELEPPTATGEETDRVTLEGASCTSMDSSRTSPSVDVFCSNERVRSADTVETAADGIAPNMVCGELDSSASMAESVRASDEPSPLAAASLNCGAEGECEWSRRRRIGGAPGAGVAPTGWLHQASPVEFRAGASTLPGAAMGSTAASIDEVERNDSSPSPRPDGMGSAEAEPLGLTTMRW